MNTPIKDFLRLAVQQRCEILQNAYGLNDEDTQWLLTFILQRATFDQTFIENAVSGMKKEE